VWNLKKGDLVEIHYWDTTTLQPAKAYGIVVDRGEFSSQLSLIPTAMVMNFDTGTIELHSPASLEIISAA
jgi:hypothetical protein